MAGVVASRVRRKKEKETGREEEIRKNQLKVKVVEMWTYVLNHWCKFPLTLGVLAHCLCMRDTPLSPPVYVETLNTELFSLSQG